MESPPPPKILKRSISTPTPSKTMIPRIYEYTHSIPFADKFPNVFELAHLTCDEKFKLLRPVSSTKVTVSPNEKLNAPCLELQIYTQPKLAPTGTSDQADQETERLQIMFLAVHREADQMLEHMTASVVDENGKDLLLLPEFKKFRKQFESDPRLASGVAWTCRLHDLWENKSKYFPTDILRVKFQVGWDFAQEYNALPKSLQSLSKDLLDLFVSGDRSDFTIKCGSSDFKVHETILITRSPVFNAMLSSDMLERDKREVTITDVDPATLKILLQFIYSSIVEPEQLEFSELCELVRAADKYELMELKHISFSYMAKEINLDNVGDISLLAFHHSASKGIQKKVSEFVSKNFGSLRKIPEFKEVMRKCLDMFWDN